MNNKLLYSLIGVGSLILISLVAYLVFSQPNQNNSNQNLSTSGFSVEDERAIKDLLTLYFDLYGTYEYEDYSNKLAVGDFSTFEMQQRLLEEREVLIESTSEGFLQIATTNKDSFTISKISDHEALVIFNGQVSTTASLDAPSEVKNVSIESFLIKEGLDWKVDRIIF